MSWYGWWNELLRPLQREADETPDPAPEASPNRRFGRLRQLQRAYGNQYVQQLLSGARGEGRPLDDATRRRMEGAFGENLEGVRVHTDAEAQAAMPSSGARAVTVGSDIFLAPNQIHPNSPTSEHLIAHELAHVVQQRRGGSEPPGAAHEADAERAAHAVQRGQPGAIATASAAGVPQFAPDEVPVSSVSERPARTIKVSTGAGEVYAPYRVEDVTRMPREYDNMRMTVRNRAFAAEIANPGITLERIAKLPDEKIPREVTLGQLRNYARTQGLRVNVLIARYGGAENLVGFDSFRIGELQAGEPSYLRQSLREGYVEGAPQARGAGRALLVRQIETAITSNLERMHVEVGMSEATRTFHQELTKAAGMEGQVAIEQGKMYWLERNQMASVLAEWGEDVISPRQRAALRDLAQAAERSGKQIPAEALKKVLSEPRILWGTPTEMGTEGKAPAAEGKGKGGGGGEPTVKSGGGGGGEPAVEGKGGGGGSGFFGKLLFAISAYYSGKHLKEAWGTEEFGITVAKEGMIWGSALTPLGPFGPPVMAFSFWFGEKFGQAMAMIPELFAAGIEALDTFAKYGHSFVSSIFFRHTLVHYLALDPENWDYRSMPSDLIPAVDALGAALWDKLGKMDVNAFRAAIHTPLVELGVPRDLLLQYAKKTLMPDPIQLMTPIKLLASFKSNKLRFVQDPEWIADYDINVDVPELEKGEATRLHDLVEARAMLDPYNWNLEDLPQTATREQDQNALEVLGRTMWSQLEMLDRDEFQRMNAMNLSSFKLSADQVQNAATALTRVVLGQGAFAFGGVEETPELDEYFRVMLLNMTLQDLIKFLRQWAKLRFKRDPVSIAKEAIEQVKQGYQPW